MTTTFEKLKPKELERILTQLLIKLHLENVNNRSNGISKFLETCANTFDIFTPRKKKILAGNHSYAIHEQKLLKKTKN